MNDLIGYSIGVIVLLTVTFGLAWAVANLCLREACPHCGADPDTTVIDTQEREHHVCAACAYKRWPNATVYNQEAS